MLSGTYKPYGKEFIKTQKNYIGISPSTPKAHFWEFIQKTYDKDKNDVCTKLFLAALFIVTKHWKQ